MKTHTHTQFFVNTYVVNFDSDFELKGEGLVGLRSRLYGSSLEKNV